MNEQRPRRPNPKGSGYSEQSNVIAIFRAACAAWQPSCAGYITCIIDAPGYQLLVTAPLEKHLVVEPQFNLSV